jgi:ABC-type amino acid transport substrate-binding protein
MKKLRILNVMLVLFLIITLIGCGNAPQSGTVTKKESQLDKIKAKGEIRAAYIPWVPMAIKDPNTGKVSGVFPEVLEKVAANAGLKVVWTEQVDYGTAIEGLKTGRYDMLGTGIWPNATRALQASFTTSLCFSAIEVFVRQDEKRIKTLDDINKTSIAIATIDGEMADSIAKQDFPNAKRSGLPQMSDTAQLYLQLANKKADVVFHDLNEAQNFMAKNPGKIKRLFPGKPLRVFGNAYMLPKGQEELKDFLDIAIQELHNIGYVDSKLKEYKMDKVTYPVALPYSGK